MKVRTTEGGVEVTFTALLPASMSPRNARDLSDTLESKPDHVFSPAVFGASEITVTSPRQMERATSEEAAAVAMEGEVQVISFSATLPAAADAAARQAYCESVRSFLVAQGELFAGRGLRHSPGGCFL